MDKNLKIAIILTAVDKATSVMNKAFAGAEAKAKTLARVGESISSAGDRMLIAGGISTAFFGKTVEDAREATKAIRVMNAAYSSLGDKGAEVAKRAQEFAEGYQLKIGVKDEDIEAVQTKFAPFQRLFTDSAQQANIFERATKLAFDMQATGFGDATQNAAKLGKLLNDPIANMNALSKVTGKMDAATKAHIETLIRQNKFTEAQQYVLGLAENKFNKNGSAAEAAADAGDRFEIAMHKLSVQIGNILLPKLTSLADRVLAYLPTIEAFISRNSGLISSIATGGAAVLALGGTFKIVGFALSGFSSVFKGVGYAIKATSSIISYGGKIASAAVKGYEVLKTGFAVVQSVITSSVIPALQTAGSAIVEFGATLLASPVTWFVAAAIAIGVAVYYIYKNWDKIKVWFANLWAKVKGIFIATWDWIKNLFLNYTPQGLIIKNWDKIVAWFSGLWDKVKSVFMGWVNWVMGLGSRFVEAGKNIALSIWTGIKAMAHKPIEAIEEMTQKMRNYLPFSPAKTGPLRDLHRVKIVETIAQAIKPASAISAMRRTTSGIYNAADMPAPTSHSAHTIHFAPVIHLHGAATKDDGNKIQKTVEEAFNRLMKNYTAQQGRVSF